MLLLMASACSRVDFDSFIYFGNGKIGQSMGHALWKFSKTFMCYLLVES